MPISEISFVKRWPFLFHTTSSINLESIREARQLRSARLLLSGTEHENLLRGRRLHTKIVSIGGALIAIRDHRPLVASTIVLQDGLTFDEYIDELNRRVFFWTGINTGPNPRGKSHFGRYQKKESLLVLRVPTRSLLSTNISRDLAVTSCNSGASPLYSHPNSGSRGLNTFQALANADFTAGKLIEVTYIDWIDLPNDTQYAHSLNGHWELL